MMAKCTADVIDPSLYIGKRCYARPLFTQWIWSRKIKAVRWLETNSSHISKGHWEVKIRNWFWHEWVKLDYVDTALYVYRKEWFSTRTECL